MLHISRPSVYQRVGKLEKNGVIKGYKGIVDWGKLDQKIKVMISVKVVSQSFKETAGQIIGLQILVIRLYKFL
ncbi:Lrp/AsnC family transcriptional regulator [Paenibacillus sp. FSL L8-0470]|uniref:Lrp/AsnC family transcriptional regulator n=1 Tax=Paenibacillus sp. FSL L8-0470 TaxID=2954688 RepID=UPI0030F9B50C